MDRPPLSCEEIVNIAERLRKEEIGMSNYQRIVNDVLVLIRDLARHQAKSDDL